MITRATLVACIAAVAGLAGCGGGLSPFSGDGPSVVSVEVRPERATVEIGGTHQFTAVARNSEGDRVSDADVLWSSSNSTVATVDSDGLATGRNGGPAWIIATAGAAADSAEIVVTPDPRAAGSVGAGRTGAP